MDSVTAVNVVGSCGIGEIIHRNEAVNALLDEGETVLPDHGIVHGALADEEFALQICGLVDKGSGLKAIRIGLRGIHIALSVHDLVPLPVNDGTARNAHLEHVRIGGHQGDGHESAVAPAVYADA